MNKKREYDNILELYSSYCEAITHLGGSPMKWSQLKKLSVQELFEILSPNYIKFEYDSMHKMEKPPLIKNNINFEDGYVTSKQ